MHMDRSWFIVSLEGQGLSDEEMSAAKLLIDRAQEEDLEALKFVIENPMIGWKYLLDNYRKKRELLQTEDGSGWGKLVAEEKQALERVAE